MDFDIEKDSKDVNSMALAAKNGRWNEVFHILDEKSHLINCIPEKRAWAALHQAVYWEDASIVKRLLEYEACDSLVATRRSLDGRIEPGSTAAVIAQSFNNPHIKKLIEDHTHTHRSKRFHSDIDFVVSREYGEKVRDAGFPLFVNEIIIYKESLDVHHDEIKLHMADLMKQIFEREEHTWKTLEGKLIQALYGVCKNAAEDLGSASTEEKFFEELILLYTKDIIYNQVNEAVGREFNEDYQPSGDDLGIGIFAFLLDIVLCFWPKAVPVSNNTYRGVSVNVAKKYKAGDTIMFTTFVSSSKSKVVADGFRKGTGTLFIINNQSNSKMKPRDISKFSRYPGEQECLYPLGAEFIVTKVDGESVYLQLLA